MLIRSNTATKTLEVIMFKVGDIIMRTRMKDFQNPVPGIAKPLIGDLYIIEYIHDDHFTVKDYKDLMNTRWAKDLLEGDEAKAYYINSITVPSFYIDKKYVEQYFVPYGLAANVLFA